MAGDHVWSGPHMYGGRLLSTGTGVFVVRVKWWKEWEHLWVRTGRKLGQREGGKGCISDLKVLASK